MTIAVGTNALGGIVVVIMVVMMLNRGNIVLSRTELWSMPIICFRQLYQGGKETYAFKVEYRLTFVDDETFSSVS